MDIFFKYDFDEVVSIEEVGCDSLRYDITVEDNNNFFANDCLVHNCQNLTKELEEWKTNEYSWEVTEKCDGSSMTAYLIDGEFGVCSRNLDLKYDEKNTFWKVAIQNEFEEKLRKCGKNIAIQGELIGNGVNGNIYKLTGHRFMLFNVYDIDKCEYYNPNERIVFANEYNIPHAPIVEESFVISSGVFVEDLLNMAEQKSSINTNVEREGIVFKCIQDPSISFKSISNKFLLKN